jgi:glycosyltransferase involved in cell wall biosynthesis
LWDGVALFVPMDDDRAFANAVETLLGDPARRIALGEAARARAARYEPAAAALAMSGIYRRLTSSRTSGDRVAA